MERPIEDILSDQPTEEIETPQVSETPTITEEQPESIVDPPSGLLRDEKGRFAPKEPTGVQEPAVEQVPVPPTEQTNQLPKEEYAVVRAIRDENRELKQQLAQIQRQLMQPAPQPQQQQPTADFWDDPHGFMNGFGQQLMQQWEQRETNKRLDRSEQAARAKYDDYSDAYDAFEQSAQQNPQLIAQMLQADDPGEFVYSRGKTTLEIQRVGSIDDLKAQIRAELEAEARQVIQPAHRLPSTTAADTSIGARSGPEWGGPPALKDILRK